MMMMMMGMMVVMVMVMMMMLMLMVMMVTIFRVFEATSSSTDDKGCPHADRGYALPSLGTAVTVVASLGPPWLWRLVLALTVCQYKDVHPKHTAVPRHRWDLWYRCLCSACWGHLGPAVVP